MQQRWEVEKAKKPRFIRERYFLSGTDSRALVRNGIGRLWWYAKMTYDSERSDKYELLRAAYLKLDIAQNLFENSFGRSRSLVHAYLEFVLRNQKQCAEATGNRERMRYLASCISNRTGVALVDRMTKQQVVDYLEFELKRYDKENSV